MAEPRKQVTERDLTGLKYFRRLLPLFERLHDVGCQRDKAGNRQLHMDQYCALVLLALGLVGLVGARVAAGPPARRRCHC